MFKEFFSFEFKQGLRKPTLYVFAAFNFLLALFLGMASVGVFNLSESDSLININSAYSISGYFISTNSVTFGLLNSIIIITILATAIQKDFQYNIHPLFFTKPISKSSYFFGRFLGAFSLTLFVFSFSLLGLYLGLMAGYGHPSLGPFSFWNFIQPFLIFVIPNLFLQGVIYFSLTTYFRNTLMAYLFAIVILIIQLATGALLADIDNKTLASLIDLTGEKAFTQITEYWTPHQMNQQLIPFKDVLLWNRSIWLLVAIIITIWSYYKFDFTQILNPIFKSKYIEKESKLIVSKYESLSDIPYAEINNNFYNKIKQCLYLALHETRRIIRSPFFIIICILGFILSLLFLVFAENWQNTQYYPVTYKMTENIGNSFHFLLIIFIIFYSGTIVWSQKDHKMDELTGVINISNTTLTISRILGLVLSTSIVLLAGCFTAITFQISQGFFDIEIYQYFIFLLESIIGISITATLCIGIQSIFTNKYVGFFVSLIPIFFIPIVLNILQIDNPIFFFNSSGGSLPYSDMNGYSNKHFVWSFYKSYWLSIVGIITILAVIFLQRGKEAAFLQRLKLNNSEINLGKLGLVLILIALAGYTGWKINHENSLTQTRFSAVEVEELLANYEKEYKHLDGIPQPKITAADLDIHLFPHEKNYLVKGLFTISNKTNKPIDTLILNYVGGLNTKYNYSKLEPTVSYQLLEENVINGIKLIQLNTPLMPGDSCIITLELSYAQVGAFTNKETSIVDNGTFFNNTNFFSIGYDSDSELQNNIARIKYNLEPKQRIADLEDTIARNVNYISSDADWIRFQATVSTDIDQIAIAPGYLQKEWVENNRKYFFYKMDSPILNFYAFQSAKYQIKKDTWKDINIEIYYHKGHEYNLDIMIESINSSLDYYTQAFGPYQHKQIRIIEFPRYGNFAQSFPNTIPYSEAVGFITKTNKSDDKIDMPFYITAHEVAHQWWGHQVVGANVQGAEMLSESLSQYSALMVMEKKYGKDAMKKFLRHEMDDYLKSRAFESKRETPLYRVENQPYIYYAKGSLVFYALKEYLGEEVLNSAIKNFLNNHKFELPPYAISLDLINQIDQVTPDSLKYLITDLFKKITIYENHVSNFSAKKITDNQYEISATLNLVKFYANEQGENILASIKKEYIEVALYGIINGKEEIIQIEKIPFTQSINEIKWTVTTKPTKIVMDPYLLLIDRKLENNSLQLDQNPIPPDLTTSKPIKINFGDDEEE